MERWLVIRMRVAERAGEVERGTDRLGVPGGRDDPEPALDDLGTELRLMEAAGVVQPGVAPDERDLVAGPVGARQGERC